MQAEARGQEFLTKSQLMDDAEHSGLSDKPIHGTPEDLGDPSLPPHCLPSINGVVTFTMHLSP